MSNHGYKFYMQECTKDYVPIDGTLKDLEKDFTSLRYSKCVGLDDYGKPKNVYTEQYADSNELRVWIPDEITREATIVKFTFYFIGEERKATFHSFMAYLYDGIHAYWDDCRNRKFYFVLTDKVAISDEMLYGDKPYFKVELTVQNLKGNTEEV